MGVQVKCPSCHRGVLLYVGMGEYHCNDVICLHGVDDISYQELELVAYAATVAEKDAEVARLREALEKVAAGAPTVQPALPPKGLAISSMEVAALSYDQAWWAAAEIARAALGTEAKP